MHDWQCSLLLLPIGAAGVPQLEGALVGLPAMVVESIINPKVRCEGE